jgi:hypothetical protein
MWKSSSIPYKYQYCLVVNGEPKGEFENKAALIAKIIELGLRCSKYQKKNAMPSGVGFWTFKARMWK